MVKVHRGKYPLPASLISSGKVLPHEIDALFVILHEQSRDFRFERMHQAMNRMAYGGWDFVSMSTVAAGGENDNLPIMYVIMKRGNRKS